MNTTQLKSFAAEARKSLLSGVKSKMNALGFKDNGTVDERDYPMQALDGTLFQGEIYDVSFYGKWMRLKDEIARYGFRQVCEEGAYTWFNRLMAIQILSRNGLIDPVLEFESPDVRIPLMVKQAHEGIRPEMTAFDATRLNAVIDNDNRITDQFAILIVAYCQSTPILYKCFGTLNDFTELLLPTNILASNGFLSLLNGSTFITQDDYKTTELIGWLYQFYISERKDEVFASFKSGHKADANDIPAATQIFTPNWIVKYMVQNTLGRIYLDNNPDSTLKDSWQYLVAAPEPVEGPRLKLSSLESYTFADLSCGSGHILGEAFDMLFEIYKEEGFTRRQAIKAIFQRNLLGIDIDTRAKQLATFTLMLKASKQWADAINCEVMPRVLDMSGLTPPNYENLSDTLPHFFLGCSAKTKAETIAAINLMQQADNLGSIMKFDISQETRAAIAESMKRWEDEGLEDFEGLFTAMRLLLALTDKYAAIAMNPPYMGSGNMNAELTKYVKDNYEDEKSDLFAVFMKVAEDRLLPNAKYGMINMHSWMFISSYEKLRNHIVDDLQIDNMLHLGPRTFDELGGEVVQNTAYVITNARPALKGYYFRLVDFAPSDLKKQNFINCCRHIRVSGDISKKEINLSPYCFNTSQSNFKKIPGSPIGYWISDAAINNLDKLKPLSHYAIGRVGLITGDSKRFIREWSEVSYESIGFQIKSNAESISSGKKWFPIHNGGVLRKWYGNLTSVVNWQNDGYEMKNDNFLGSRCKSHNYNGELAFKESFSWNTISSDKFTCRYAEEGFMFDTAGPFGQIIAGRGMNIFSVMGILNSKIASLYLALVNPTINFPPGCVLSLPVNTRIAEESIQNLVKTCISISKLDWDAHETSWDFKENELVRVFKEGKAKDLQATVSAYKEEWEKKFKQLHDNEEELNRQFIEIYGLQDELSPEVPEEDVTILQQGELMFIPAPGSENWKTPIWCDDNIIRQFLSYAIGCYMGRYRLDRPGPHIAHPNPTAEELAPYEVPELVEGSSPESFAIDDDGIIPFMPIDSGFPDCAATRMSEFIKLVFGEENHAANLSYLEKTLGKDLESYFAKDFYADHKKRYQNRPIYWLFSSNKGAFQVLVYMHRMTPFTVERIRSKYLLPYIERLTNRINDLNASILKLTSAQARTLQKLEKDLQECREYHDLLHPVANQNIAINLDDGVVVNYAKFGPVLAKLK